MPGDPPKITINGAAFTGALKQVRKPTGYEKKPAPHDLLKKWVEVNLDVVIKYWDGDIEYTEDAIAALKPIH